jgi:ribosomal protein S20
MPRISGVLGERVLRKVIKQLSDSITRKTPLDKQQEILRQIMSLREELHAGSLIHKQRRERRKARNVEPPKAPPTCGTDGAPDSKP